MTEDNLMYGITLEDYSSPRFEGKTAFYCGSKTELEEFIKNLGQKEWVKARYAAMIQAFQDPAKKTYPLFDQEYPATHRLQLLYNQEDFLKSHRWSCSADDYSIYHFYAAQLIISRILVKDSDHIYRFIRARINGLQVNLQGQGWVKVKDQLQGFPGVYSYENDQHIMNLYICDKTYEEYDERLAFLEVKDMDDEELVYITQDLLGEGFM